MTANRANDDIELADETSANASVVDVGCKSSGLAAHNDVPFCLLLFFCLITQIHYASKQIRK